MTRSQSLSAALRRLREQVKIEATVLLDAVCEFHRQVRAALPDAADAFIQERVERRDADRRAEIDPMLARSRANRLYMAAMSQASQSAEDSGELARLSWLALESFRDADQEMYLAELDPASHPQRAMAVQRLEWRGGRRPDGGENIERTNPHDVLEAMVAELWSYDDLPTEREALAMVGGTKPTRRKARNGRAQDA